jgi:arsenate reductase
MYKCASMEKLNNIIKISKALSDPGRVKILVFLAEGEKCICEISEFAGISESTASRHMKTLEETGLVVSRKDSKWRYFSHSSSGTSGPAQYALAMVLKYLEGEINTLKSSGETDKMCKTKPKVMFLCTANSCRSQMAEAFLRKYGKDFFHVYSAGMVPEEVNPMTKQVMLEKGIDISDQSSKSIFEFLGKMHFGYLITVCSRANEQCPIFPGISTRLFWPFEDPLKFEGTDEEKLIKFREIRDNIELKISEWVKDYKQKNNIYPGELK